MAIVENLDHSATIILLNKISNITKSETTSKNAKMMAKTLKDSILLFFGYTEIRDFYSQSLQINDTKTLPALLAELDQLIGLDSVKSKVNDLIAYQKIQILRKQSGLNSSKNTLHLAFTGNPGTGKTTVARIVGRIYKQIGLLSKGHFIEVSRTDLIAGYQGQTALKVKKVIEKAKGGVLFIDEAYSITENEHSDSYGRECLTELTKALEDYRDDLVVIVAGYTEPMKNFFNSNPGLKSRFNTFIHFDNYNASELSKIFCYLCKENDYIIEEKALTKVYLLLEKSQNEQTDNFSNGRYVRNLFDDIIMNQSRRLSENNNGISKETLMLIKEDDVP